MRPDELLTGIRGAVRRHGLFHAGDRVLVAVSGGADSVALLYALHDLAPRLGIRLAVAHLNHGIRGRAADEDARFVRRLARRLRVPLIAGKTSVPRLARRSGRSLEMAARAARYAFLARAARQADAALVATAHTADDQAETVLLRLARGAGLRGLAGIPRDGLVAGVRVVRPMLDATRGEVLAFLRRRAAAWREDESNRDVAVPRNRVRRDVLPFLEGALNPRIRETLVRTAEVLREEDAWLEAQSRRALRACRAAGGHPAAALDVVRLRRQPLAIRRRAIRLWLAAAGVAVEDLDFAAVERVDGLARETRGSARVPVGGGRVAARRYGELRVEAAAAPARAGGRWPVCVPGETPLPELGLRVTATVGPGIVKPRPARVGKLPARASLSLAGLGRRKLFVRTWRNGDRMRPFGLRGSKKLQDIFVDARVPADERARVPLFECGGEIVWLPGYRIAQGWEVADPADRALQLAVEPLG